MRLTREEPTVTLTRLQSGLGALVAGFQPGSAAGDAAMGMVLETSDGVVHVVQALGDPPRPPPRPGPPAPARCGPPPPPARPAPLGAREPAARLLADLRQIHHLRRFLLYGYSPSVAVLEWDAMLLLTTRAGSRIEVPVDLGPMSGTVALLSAYNVHGELVLRAEDELVPGPPEETARRYGYDYPWRDGRFPIR